MTQGMKLTTGGAAGQHGGVRAKPVLPLLGAGLLALSVGAVGLPAPIAAQEPTATVVQARSSGSIGKVRIQLSGDTAGQRVPIILKGVRGPARGVKKRKKVSAQRTIGKLSRGVYRVKAKRVALSDGAALRPGSVSPGRVRVRPGRTSTVTVALVRIPATDSPTTPVVPSDPGPTPTPTQQPVGPDPAPSPSDTPSGGGDWSGFESEVLALTNEARKTGGDCGGERYGPAPALAANDGLRAVAFAHSKDMAERNFFDHDNPGGQSPFDRMRAAGITFSYAGENIAAGYPTATDVVEGWLDSPGHCANMLSADFTELGVGYYQSGSSAYGSYWTQNFISPR